MLSLCKLVKILIGVEPNLTGAVGLMGRVYSDLGGFWQWIWWVLPLHQVYTNLGLFFFFGHAEHLKMFLDVPL